MTVRIKTQGIVNYILLTCFLCGTLDALSAIIINIHVQAAVIFRYVASGYFGRSAMGGGIDMVVYGLSFHYFISLVWTILLYLLYPFLIKIFRSKIILAIVLGLGIFAVMNYLVVPYLSYIIIKPMSTTGTLKNIAALIISFGFPITFIADSYYSN